MLRVVIQTSDFHAAAMVSGPVVTGIKSFDVDIPEIEEYLKDGCPANGNAWKYRHVIGVEILPHTGTGPVA